MNARLNWVILQGIAMVCFVSFLSLSCIDSRKLISSARLMM